MKKPKSGQRRLKVGSSAVVRHWVSIVDAKPEVGQIIACTAEHRNGGPMYWAGRVTELRGNLVIMETRGETAREFAITHDTLWCLLPNDKILPTREGEGSTKTNDDE